jgi:tetratricopeptide (TPR) repeat protein/predicted Ser/Thr protein kinase
VTDGIEATADTQPVDVASDLASASSDSATVRSAADGLAIDTLSPLPLSAVDLTPGTFLGRFEIERRIGSGAMGVVYSAHDPQLDRRVAVKLIKAPGSKGTAGRFSREAKLMARLSHPNIVVVHDAGEVDGRLFIAMELIDGETLPAWLKHPRPRHEILRLLDQAGRGLAAAHQAGIVHRDFKPGNVLIGSDGRARVVDFGVARWADDAATVATPRQPRDDVRTTNGTIPGTPAYMAPEQQRGHPATPQSDQYSFCLSLWEALSGARPERGQARPGGLPRAVRRILERGLAESPDARWPSVIALLDALSRASNRRRRTAATAISALAATSLVGALLLRPPEPPACRPAEERLIGVWDGDRKAVMRRGFLATHLPYAEHQWQTVEHTVDRYASAWTSRSNAACTADGRGDEPSHALREPRRTCLDRRLDHLRLWLNVFATPDVDLVRNAAQAVAGLEDLAVCDDPEQSELPVPTDPGLAAEVKVLRKRLAAEQLRASYGPYKQAVAALRGILAEAEQRGYRPLVAESLAAIGKAEQDASDFKAALVTWLALRDLSEETHQDRQRVMAWSGLAFTYGSLFQFDKAHDAVRVATTIVRPMSRTTTQALRIALEIDDASAWWGEGQLERALVLYRHAETELEQLFGPDSYRLARNEIDLATLLVEMRRLDEAEPLYSRALARFLAMNGDSHPGVAMIVNNQGNLYFQKRDYQHALERYREALAIKDRAGIPADNLGRAYTNLNVGETLVQLHRPDDAIVALGPALATIAAQLGDNNDYFLEALTWMGLAELGAGHPAQAATRLERAVAGRVQKGSSPAQLAEAQLGLARALWDAHPDQRARARSLAATARAAFATAHDDARRAEADAWIAGHPR